MALPTAVPAAADTSPQEPHRPSTVTLYAGRLLDEQFVRIVTLRPRGDFRSSSLVAGAFAREFARPGEALHFEVEGQLGRHFGHQQHWEMNAAVLIRWTGFPWRRYLHTGVALAEGLSYALERPPLERVSEGDNPRLLNYLMAEIELGLPAEEGWRMLVRVHHRSPVFDLFGEASGTNFVTLGVRYRF